MKRGLHKTTFIFLLLIVFTTAFTQNYNKPQVPNLVIFINIDELQTEHLLKFKNKFTKHGFNQIIDHGTFFHNSDYETNTTYKGTKLTNLYTGTYPSFHGIISDKWFDLNQSSAQNAYSFQSEDVENHPDSGFISTSEILSSTIADELLIMTRGKSKVASVSIDPEDQAYFSHSDKTIEYWFDRTTGRMITSSKDSLADWVKNLIH